MCIARPGQRLELELVKRERSSLMDALAALKADEGRGGSSMQAQDLRRLRHELQLKQDRLNELHSVRAASSTCPLPACPPRTHASPSAPCEGCCWANATRQRNPVQ